MTFTRPWEALQGSRPWETATPVLYPRTLTINRPPTLRAPPLDLTPGYQGATEASETLVIAGIPGNVEIAASGRNSASGNLPDDSPGPIKYTITIPSFVTLPLILDGDIVYDEMGNRYQVSAFIPTPLGARIDSVRAET